MSKSRTDKKHDIHSSDEDESSAEQKDDDYDLFMDEEEREKFNKMSEKEREIEIFKRLEEREIKKTREQIKRKLMAAGKKSTDGGGTSLKKRKRQISDGSNSDQEKSGASDRREDAEEGEIGSDSSGHKKSSKVRSKAVVKDEVGDDGDPLDAEYHKPSELTSKQNKKKAMADLLSKRRDRKQAEEKRKKEAQKAALDLDEVFGNDDEEAKSLSSSSSSSSSTRSSSPASSKSRSPSPEVKQEIKTNDELTRCQLFRRKLALFVHASFFKKTVIGCFVRILIGSNKVDGRPVYRAVQIVDVVETAKIYEVVPEVRTNIGLRLKACDSDPPRVFRLEFVSNDKITESEFAFWLNQQKQSNTPLPTVDFVERKRKEIMEALNYKYTEAEINLLVKEKQRFKKQPTNFAFQKAELLKMKEVAEQLGDFERIRDLQHQINELEEKAKKIENQRTKNLSAVNYINQRNRDHMKSTFLSAIGQPADQGKDDDPFTRKSARMKVVSGTTRSKLNMPEAGEEEGKVPAITSLGASSSLSAKAPHLSATDLISAHGIDINIELKLPAITSGFRAPPIIDTHPQTSRVLPQKSGGSRTLTLEEYKKKRGLV